MKKDLIFWLSIIVIGVLMINISVIFIKISDFKKISGHVSKSSFVNITVLSSVGINLTINSINWGSGSINATGNNRFNATLYTNNSNDGIVLRGNWSGEGVYGFIVENIGTINSSLYLVTGKNSSDLFSSLSGTNQQYMLNVSEKESGSCLSGTLGTWNNVNKTNPGTLHCDNFGFNSEADELYIDVLLTVPYDAGNLGNLSDILTVTVYAV